MSERKHQASPVAPALVFSTLFSPGTPFLSLGHKMLAANLRLLPSSPNGCSIFLLTAPPTSPSAAGPAHALLLKYILPPTPAASLIPTSRLPVLLSALLAPPIATARFQDAHLYALSLQHNSFVVDGLLRLPSNPILPQIATRALHTPPSPHSSRCTALHPSLLISTSLLNYLRSIVALTMTNNSPPTINQRLAELADAGDADGLARLLAQTIESPLVGSQPICNAARNGHTECVRILIPFSDPKANDSYPLRWATNHGHVECVRLLIPVSDPKALDSRALLWAAENGYTECAQLLIPASDPKARDSALFLAAFNGRQECVRLLIPASDPKAKESNALRLAAENGHAECVNLLIPVSDPLLPSSQLLASVLELGRANILSIMLTHEPLLLRGMNLPRILNLSIAQGHSDLAILLSSIIDHSALATLLPLQPAHISPRSQFRI